MNTAEYRAAFKLAQSSADLSKVSTDHLFGCGLKEFQPTTTTIEAVAALMRWQALCFNGSWDMEALEDVRFIGRKKFIIIDGEFAVVPGTFTPEVVTAIKCSARMYLANQPL